MSLVQWGRGKDIKLSPDYINSLEAAFAEGATKTGACDYAGITLPTYERWFNIGKALYEGTESRDVPLLVPRLPTETDEQFAYREDVYTRNNLLYVELYLRCTKASGQLRLDALKRIREAALTAKHWTAAAWLLERRFPSEYGQRSRVRSEVEVSGEVKHSHSVDQFAELYSKLGYTKRDELESGDIVEGEVVEVRDIDEDQGS